MGKMTALIINPGSHIGEPGNGWTNTAGTAQAHAADWLAQMHRDGMTGVELLDGSTEQEGRWVFSFRHRVTGTVVKLEMHDINDVEAYQRERIFPPRVYWNGSSTSNPELEDFAAPGFVPVRTFARPCHRCELPIPGTPVTDPDDPLHREFCRDECRDAEAQASYEQRYQPGAAT